MQNRGKCTLLIGNLYASQRKWGLRLRNLESMNVACFLKLVWKLLSNEEGLWAEVIRSKYNRNCNWCKDIQVKNSDSFLWKELGKIWHYM